MTRVVGHVARALDGYALTSSIAQQHRKVAYQAGAFYKRDNIDRAVTVASMREECRRVQRVDFLLTSIEFVLARVASRSSGNPFRIWLECLADWPLLEHSESDVEDIIRAAGLAPLV